MPFSVEIREHFEAVEDRMEAAFASSRKLEFPASVTEALRNSNEIPSSSDEEFCIGILDFGPGI